MSDDMDPEDELFASISTPTAWALVMCCAAGMAAELLGAWVWLW